MKQYLINLFNSLFFKSNVPDNKNILGSIQFEIDKESKINVVCGFPDFDDFSNIDSLSQTFARFLYTTVSIKMREEILTIIKNNSKSPIDDLFYENLVFNLIIMEQERKNNSTNRQNQPIIKPSQVFSIARQK